MCLLVGIVLRYNVKHYLFMQSCCSSLLRYIWRGYAPSHGKVRILLWSGSCLFVNISCASYELKG